MKKEINKDEIKIIRQCMAELARIFETGCLLSNTRGLFDYVERFRKENTKVYPYEVLISLPVEENEMKKIPLERAEKTTNIEEELTNRKIRFCCFLL